MSRTEGRRYCDPVAQVYQVEHMPDPIRLRPATGATPQQMSVYEEFARHVPGFAASSNSNNMSDLIGQSGSNHNRQHVVSHFSELYHCAAVNILVIET